MAKASALRDIIGRFLKTLDPVLSSAHVPLSDRVLRAAILFAEEMVLDVRGGTKTKPIGQPWFDAIHFEVLRWYARRYRDAMDQDRDGSAKGVVFLRSTPLALSFPLTVVRPGEAPSTRRIYFPEGLRDDERALSFLVSKVSLRGFSKPERAQLEEDVGVIVKNTRTLNRALRFSSVGEKGRQLANRAMWTLGHAVESIAAGTPDRRGLAVWELNLLAELCLKVFLHSRQVPPPKTHSVRPLHHRAVEAGLTPFEATDLARFPSERNAIRFRYGERTAPTMLTTAELYRTALALSLHAASQCKRTFSVAHDGWIEVRTIGALARGG